MFLASIVKELCNVICDHESQVVSAIENLVSEGIHAKQNGYKVITQKINGISLSLNIEALSEENNEHHVECCMDDYLNAQAIESSQKINESVVM